MTKKEMSSVELFRKFQPRFSEIVWHAGGLQGDNLLLLPGYPGEKGSIPSILLDSEGTRYLWWCDEADKRGCRPVFNVREGNLAFNAFNFAPDPSKEETIEDKLKNAMMRTIYDGPFNGRRFFMRPKAELNGQFCRTFRIPIEFYTDGCGPIQGLRLGKAVAYNWEFFIPEGLHRETIQTAVDLERAQGTQAMYPGEYPDLVDTMQELRVRLRLLCACFL